MARKFKIGDTVNVATSAQGQPYADGFRKGVIGVVTDCCRIDSCSLYPYEVESKSGKRGCFSPEELVLVERKSR